MEEEKTRVVYGDINEKLVDELSRSVTRESIYPVAIDPMADRLFNKWSLVIGVREIGSY